MIHRIQIRNLALNKLAAATKNAILTGVKVARVFVTICFQSAFFLNKNCKASICIYASLKSLFY